MKRIIFKPEKVKNRRWVDRLLYHLLILGGSKLVVIDNKWVSTSAVGDRVSLKNQDVRNILERAKVGGCVSRKDNPKPENRVHHDIKWAKPSEAVYWRPTSWGIRRLVKLGVIATVEM